MNNHDPEPYLFDQKTWNAAAPPLETISQTDTGETIPLPEITAEPGSEEYEKQLFDEFTSDIQEFSSTMADKLRTLQNHARPFLDELEVSIGKKQSDTSKDQIEAIEAIKGRIILWSKFKFDIEHSYCFVLDDQGDLYHCQYVQPDSEWQPDYVIPNWTTKTTDPRYLFRFYDLLIPELSKLILEGKARSADART